MKSESGGWIWPIGMLVIGTTFAAVLLTQPLRLPLGPNYWDIYTYIDTAYRISVGQLPHVDFFVPVGSLGYVLYIGLMRLFPEAHPLLAVHFAILVMAVPLMAVVAVEAGRRSRMEALMLVLPFLFFGLIPINGLELYPSPGFDGYGNYNRHAALLLYVLAATLLFVERRNLVGGLAVMILAALFMTKVTGFIVALVLVVHAVMAGRLAWRGSAIGTAFVAIVLAIIQWRYGLVTAYIADIVELVSMNTGSLLPRVLTVLSVKFDVIAAVLLLLLALVWRQRHAIQEQLAGLAGPSRLAAFRTLLDGDAVWILSLLAAGAVFETQNTGSHEFILLWPALLRLLRGLEWPWERQDALIAILVAAVAIPTPLSILHRTLRTVASAAKYEPVQAPLMGAVARVSGKPEIMLQSRAMLAHYPMSRASYEMFAKRNVLPSYILFSEIDFQISWLVSSDQAARAILAYEQGNKRFFPRVVTLDFVDPMPVMLKRQPLRDMSIGNDPERTLAKLGAHAIAEIASADAILLPKCPVTNARLAIANAYAPSLQGRRLVALTPCFDMLVKD